MADKDLYDAVLTANETYNKNKDNWQYLRESYVGGAEYKAGKHLTKYTDEDSNEYVARLEATHLDNHCASVISVYNSFLFRDEVSRDLGTLSSIPESEAFINDADYDGRSLDDFMKEVSTWASVYGHSWVIVAKPNINAYSRADEIAYGVRPYVSLLTPLAVLDWRFKRSVVGSYQLVYLKYIEEINGTETIVKEWTADVINTFTLDTDNEVVVSVETITNGIGIIPAVIAYNRRASRGTGISDINDIADAQKTIYNNNSEIEQSIRVDSHPTTVVPKDTDLAAGAGAIIEMPDDIDPGLKPYVLNFTGANITSILADNEAIVASIDKMANTGAVRATDAKMASGVAQQTEFQLLNARLSDKADNLELAEEQMWKLIAKYQDKVWTGYIEYPGSFNIQDTQNEYAQLKTAKEAATDSSVLRIVDKRIIELLGEDPETVQFNETVVNNDNG